MRGAIITSFKLSFKFSPRTLVAPSSIDNLLYCVLCVAYLRHEWNNVNLCSALFFIKSICRCRNHFQIDTLLDDSLVQPQLQSQFVAIARNLSCIYLPLYPPWQYTLPNWWRKRKGRYPQELQQRTTIFSSNKANNLTSFAVFERGGYFGVKIGVEVFEDFQVGQSARHV